LLSKFTDISRLPNMPKKAVQEEQVKKAMGKLFECIRPFKIAVRSRDIAAVVNQQPVDAGLAADVIIARIRELEECLCTIFWSILLLIGYQYESGKSANLILI
jgi:hypothetical protein